MEQIIGGQSTTDGRPFAHIGGSDLAGNAFRMLSCIENGNPYFKIIESYDWEKLYDIADESQVLEDLTNLYTYNYDTEKYVSIVNQAVTNLYYYNSNTNSYENIGILDKDGSITFNNSNINKYELIKYTVRV